MPDIPPIEHGLPNEIDPVAKPVPVAGAIATGAVVTIGATQVPEALSIQVAGKPRETQEEKFVVEAADPANGTQIIVAEPLR